MSRYRNCWSDIVVIVILVVVVVSGVILCPGEERGESKKGRGELIRTANI